MHVLIIDDQLARDRAERQLLLDRTGMVDANDEKSQRSVARDAVIVAEFCSGQVEHNGMLKNDCELIARAVGTGWDDAEDQWNLVLLDVHFDSGRLDVGGVPSGGPNDSTFGEKAYETLIREFPGLPVVLFTTKAQIELTKTKIPYASKEAFNERELRIALLRHGRLSAAQSHAILQLGEQTIVAAPVMIEAFREAFVHAEHNIPVAIIGESGTGKELMARYIHQQSPRKDGHFVPVNVAAIPAGLAEATLFGAEKGAYTGAHRARQGVFEQANGGTLFLDEIGDMPLDIQAKTLRVLQEHVVTSVGGDRDRSVDVRVICATHQPLLKFIESGMFRADLWDRLNSVVIALPPLRERREDVALLSQYFLDKYVAEYGKKGIQFEKEVLTELDRVPFHGNVRTLENLIRRIASALGNNSLVTVDLLRGELTKASVVGPSESSATDRYDSLCVPGIGSISLGEFLRMAENVECRPESGDINGVLPLLQKTWELLLQKLVGAALEKTRDPVTERLQVQPAMRLLTGDHNMSGNQPARTLKRLIGHKHADPLTNEDLENCVNKWLSSK